MSLYQECQTFLPTLNRYFITDVKVKGDSFILSLYTCILESTAAFSIHVALLFMYCMQGCGSHVCTYTCTNKKNVCYIPSMNIITQLHMNMQRESALAYEHAKRKMAKCLLVRSKCYEILSKLR